MRSIKWSTSEAIWIDEIDDEHKAIFAVVADMQRVLLDSRPLADIRAILERLTGAIKDHFAHEQRLMHASRYPGLGWHKRQHYSARRNVRRFTLGIERGDRHAGLAMVEYLTAWLRNHTRVADRMMGSYLRNQRLNVGKLVFRAGTKPADACTWVDSTGNTFDPLAPANDL
jgi:hemerythrin